MTKLSITHKEAVDHLIYDCGEGFNPVAYGVDMMELNTCCAYAEVSPYDLWKTVVANISTELRRYAQKNRKSFDNLYSGLDNLFLIRVVKKYLATSDPKVFNFWRYQETECNLLATTIDTQTDEIAMLKIFGFEPRFQSRNPNSGNIVTLWEKPYKI